MLRNLWLRIGVLLFWLSWPALWVYLRLGTRTRLLITTTDGDVLFLKGWLGAGDWGLPGGGLHRGEDPKQGAIRELREETGLALQADQLTLLGQENISEHGLRSLNVIYRVQLPKATDVTPQRGEIVDIQWAQPAELIGMSSATKALCDRWL